VRKAYPVYLDLSERVAVIVGAGKVAARKASRLIDAGAGSVKIIAPEQRAALPPSAVYIRESYQPQHLSDADLVFAATDIPDINAQVVRDAISRKIWVNRADADDTDAGDFITPATHTDGPITFTLSAESAALSAYLRNQLIRNWDPAWTQLAETMQLLRPVIRDRSNLAPAERATIFKTLASDEALAVLRASGRDALIEWIRAKHPNITHA